MFFYLSFFWFIRTTKIILFYLYLWQLKEYHLGRFIDHFRTAKGASLLFNKLNFLKIVLFLPLFFFLYFPLFFNYPYLSSFPNILLILYPLLPSILLILYFVESLKAFIDLPQKKLKFPVLTKKAAFLSLAALFLEIIILLAFFYFKKNLEFFAFWLLTLDIFTPVVTSAIVLAFQPLTCLLRSRIIRKAKLKRESFKNLMVIGITGSYGKTSTKEFLYTVLSQKATLRGGTPGASKVLKTAEHQNSEAGISQCILNNLNSSHEIFIVEMGAYGRGGIKLLCQITKPKIGVLTGINEQHMALMGSQKNIIKTKYELIEALPEKGLAIFNGDNPYCLELYQKTNKPKKIFTAQPQNLKFRPDLWAEGISCDKKSLFFKVCTQAECDNFKVYLSGAHFISNLLAAILVAKELGMSSEEIVRACLKIEAPKKTMNISEGVNNLIIIDDSYSANPEGVIAALNYLKIYPQKKIIVMPCLIELGKASKEVHQKIGKKIGRICDLAIIVTKEHLSEIEKGALEVGFNKKNILFGEDPEIIFEKIIDFCKRGGVVLLESRVPERLINLLTGK